MNKGAVGLLDTQKFDTFYRVFKKTFENKRSSKPFGLLPFGASLVDTLDFTSYYSPVVLY